jgi:nitric oxide reductase NorE protein
VADTDAAVAARKTPAARRIPGEAGIWVLILGDMAIFAMFFFVFVYYRGCDPSPYIHSQSTLNQTAGVLNTLLMLTSSLFVARAVDGARKSLPERSANCLSFALVCGLGFVIVKAFEYGQKLRAGITVETDEFFMYYYVLTGIHLGHVLIGIGVLLFIQKVARAGDYSHKALGVIESGASFWHLVDSLWLVLFALLYLMK